MVFLQSINPAVTPLAARLAHRFRENFRKGLPGSRTIGREAEFLLVDKESGAAHKAADVNGALWHEVARLAGPSSEIVYDTGKDNQNVTVGVKTEHVSFLAEVGQATVEIVTSPCDCVHDAANRFGEAIGLMKEAAGTLGAGLLGSGVHPITPPDVSLMTRKQRYSELLKAIGTPWLWFTVTASDQTHVSISRDELERQMVLQSSLSGLTIALCGNSPMSAGSDTQICSSRENGMSMVRGPYDIPFRSGMNEIPLALDETVQMNLQRAFFLDSQRKAVIPPSTFVAYIETKETELTEEDIWTFYLVHDHYVWPSARPRTAYSTIELRAACQQPPEDTNVVTALNLGLVEAAGDIEKFLHCEIGPHYWAILRDCRQHAIKHGLEGDPQRGPINTNEDWLGLITGVLDQCHKALVQRGLGEERYLLPLYTRVSNRCNPAQLFRSLWEKSPSTALQRYMF